MKQNELKALANELEQAIHEGMDNVSASQLGKNDALVAFLVAHEFTGTKVGDNEQFTAVLDVKWPTSVSDDKLKRKNQKIRSDIKSIAIVAPHYEAMKVQCNKLANDADIQEAYDQCSPAQMMKRLTTIVKDNGKLAGFQNNKNRLVKVGLDRKEKRDANKHPTWGADPIGYLKYRVGQLDKNKFTGLEAVAAALDAVTVPEEKAEVPNDLVAAFAALSSEKKQAAIQALHDAQAK